MKLGISVHPERGVDAVMDEARVADEQGFDSLWLSDHLYRPYVAEQAPEGPLDYFVLATALGAVTSRIRLAWGTLNLHFRPPGVFAKMITTLDQITHGRVICSFGSGWLKDEYEAYNLLWVEDHDQRADYARETVRLIKELWTHPAPEKVTFEGKYVQVRDLTFNPEPYQKPHPPIWFGGDSEATLQTVKELCSGWIPLRSGTTENIARLRAEPDWPSDMTIVKSGRIVVAESRERALALAKDEWDAGVAKKAIAWPQSFEDYVSGGIVGTPEECLAKLGEMESTGVNYLRLNFQTEAVQEGVSRLLLPRLEPAIASIS
ncbi:MAG TPA: LLM class flavin-dependent oxidoreductase [Dehalococcoidia bacterium]|nr:LLM class flavin-dependent oxidoreductase [Dehalococcoidia bacterium]